jgi:outer membrane protein W
VNVLRMVAATTFVLVAAPRAHADWWDPPVKKRWYFRAGAAYVAPLTSSQPMTLANIDGPASLAVKDGPIPGSGASADGAAIPAVIIGYVLPWWDRKVSLETVLGPPLEIVFHGTGTLATQSIAPTALGLPTGVPPLGSQLGEAKAAPPVVTAVYALPALGPLRPYAGGGLAILFSYDATITNPLLTAVGKPEFSISPAPGLALQTGIEATVYKRIYARLDIKFIALMLAHAEVDHIQIQAPDIPLFGSVEVGTAKMSMWVNPLIVQAAIGTDF